MRNQIASIGINQSEETYLLAPKSLYKGRPNLEKICCWIILAQHRIDSNEASASPVRPPSGRGAKVAPAAIDSDAPLVLPADPSEFAAAEPSHVIIPKLSAAERSMWSVLYCGNVAPVRQQLKVVSRAWGFLYSEESFGCRKHARGPPGVY